MTTETWRDTTSTGFVVLGVVLSILLMIGAVLPIRAALAGRAVYRDPGGSEIELLSGSGVPFASKEFRDSLPPEQRAALGTIEHDPSVQWSKMVWGIFMIIFAAITGGRCVFELRRRRRTAPS